jgi:2-C-methyl-D-erythritol 4-phosphate cytidylyltransferase
MGGRKKALLELGGEPILRRSLQPFLALSQVEAVAVALPADEVDSPPEWLPGLDPRIRIVPGGTTRLHSVLRALEALPPELELVLVHDAARPLVTSGIIRRCLEGVAPGVGAVAGWPVVDTLKRVDGEGFVVETPDRSHLWRAQTPQAFPMAELLAAYRHAAAREMEATDDAGVFTASGGRVRMVEGSPWNLKVTHPGDLPVAERLLEIQGEEGP